MSSNKLAAMAAIVILAIILYMSYMKLHHTKSGYGMSDGPSDDAFVRIALGDNNALPAYY